MNAAAAIAFQPAFVPTFSLTEMVSHRSDLVRFAQRKPRDPLMAEEAVHVVFEAVLSGRAVFAGRAALRSWLIAVLEHKIVDFECPQPRPGQITEPHPLLTIVLDRIEALPPGLRDVMRLRVLEEQSTEDECRALGISEESLFVRIHRARERLLCRVAMGPSAGLHRPPIASA